MAYAFRREACWWYRDDMVIIWKATIIIHNMIIENKQGDPNLNQDYLFEGSPVMEPMPRVPLTFTRFSKLTNLSIEKTVTN
jgi:hypothetical protein